MAISIELRFIFRFVQVTGLVRSAMMCRFARFFRLKVKSSFGLRLVLRAPIVCVGGVVWLGQDRALSSPAGCARATRFLFVSSHHSTLGRTAGYVHTR